MRLIPQVQPTIGELEMNAVAEVLKGGWITEGSLSADFVAKFSQLILCDGVLAPNGTLALWMAMHAVGIRPGDEVIIPDTTFFGSASAIMGLGAVPVPVDVDPHWYMLTPETIETAITSRTRAIMVVHLYGNACPMAPILQLAARHGLLVIEDAAQGVGVKYDGQPVGSLGTVGAFSFFADKTITMGEGGFVASHDQEVLARLAYLRNQGRIDRGSFVHPKFGMNFRITDLQAAIGVAQLKRLPEIVERKAHLWNIYRNCFADRPDVRLIDQPPGSDSVPFRAVIEVPDKARCISRLERAGVLPREAFFPIARQPGYQEYRQKLGLVPEDPADRTSDYHYAHGVCLPIHPSMTEAEVGRVCDAVLSR